MNAKVSIRLIRGIDWVSTSPEFILTAGLNLRTGVIQDTYLEGNVEGMHFDEPLWRTLVDYVGHFSQDASVTVIEDLRRRREIPLANYLTVWQETAPLDRDPPQVILARESGTLRVAMVTDAWSRVGGPMPYHDSYTYSLFAERDLTVELQSLLTGASGMNSWLVDPGPIQASSAPKPSMIKSIAARLGLLRIY